MYMQAWVVAAYLVDLRPATDWKLEAPAGLLGVCPADRLQASDLAYAWHIGGGFSVERVHRGLFTIVRLALSVEVF